MTVRAEIVTGQLAPNRMLSEECVWTTMEIDRAVTQTRNEELGVTLTSTWTRFCVKGRAGLDMYIFAGLHRSIVNLSLYPTC